MIQRYPPINCYIECTAHTHTGTTAIWAAQRIPDSDISVVANEFVIEHIPLISSVSDCVKGNKQKKHRTSDSGQTAGTMLSTGQSTDLPPTDSGQTTDILADQDIVTIVTKTSKFDPIHLHQTGSNDSTHIHRSSTSTLDLLRGTR